MFLKHSNQFDTGLARLAPAAALSGFFPGTRVETAEGWRDVASLRPGTRVYTYDGGLRTLRQLRITAAARDAVRLPACALGNDADTYLPADQMILVDTGEAMDWLGTPVALARAADLVGSAGVKRRAAPAGRLITLVFDEEEVIFAATGLRVHCPGAATLGASDHFTVLSRDEIVAALAA